MPRQAKSSKKARTRARRRRRSHRLARQGDTLAALAGSAKDFPYPPEPADAKDVTARLDSVNAEGKAADDTFLTQAARQSFGRKGS